LGGIVLEGRGGLALQVAVYRFSGKTIKRSEIVPEGKSEFQRFHYSKRADSNRDRDIRFVNDPYFPFPAFAVYRWDVCQHNRFDTSSISTGVRYLIPINGSRQVLMCDGDVKLPV
jgi:hypothetical protein